MRSSESRRKRALDSDEADGQPQPIKSTIKRLYELLVAASIRLFFPCFLVFAVQLPKLPRGSDCSAAILRDRKLRSLKRSSVSLGTREHMFCVPVWHFASLCFLLSATQAREVMKHQVAEEMERQVQEKGRGGVCSGKNRLCQTWLKLQWMKWLANDIVVYADKLKLVTEVLQPLYTCETIGGEQAAAIDVVLLDANTGQIAESGPESSLKLNVVPLKGDFNVEDSWTLKEFEDNVVQPREGKCPVLTGDLQVKLKDGVGKLGNVKFTDNSSRQANRRFRLGLMVASDYCEGIRIHEAKTEAFIVLDQRGESYKKHFPPSWDDEVWRLVEIARGGKYCKRLNDAQINTVEDLLRFWARNHRELEYKLKGMPKKRLNNLVEHAKTCIPSGKDYFYSREGGVKNVVIFNSLYQFKGLIARSFPEQIRAPDGRNLQLCFTTIVLQPLYTCETIGGEQGVAIDVVLLDADTGQIVESGPESSLKLNVVPLKGDFNVEDNWTLKEFEDNVVQPREGKGPILTGDLQVKLKDGVGKLGNVKFTDNSSRQANRRFRLGLKVASDYCEGIRIREAKTEAFIVLDQREESYKKHFPPSWDDEVWRLVEIARGGEYCKRLNDAQINTVKDLLRFGATNHKGLEDVRSI
ncbi:hypothetical protein Ancab_033748 [Ancistrocladus abbreviatus]